MWVVRLYESVKTQARLAFSVSEDRCTNANECAREGLNAFKSPLLEFAIIPSRPFGVAI
jgi:hypothetical protein